MFSAVMTGSEGTQSGTASKTLFSADSISTAGFHFARPYHKDTEERPWHPHKDHIFHVSPFAVEYVDATISDWKHSHASLDWLKKQLKKTGFVLRTYAERSLTSLLGQGLHRIVCVLLFCCTSRPCGGDKWIQRFVIMTKSRDQTCGNNERHVCLTRLSVCCHSTGCLSVSSFTLRWHKQSLIWPPLNQSQVRVSLIPGDSHWFD